MSSKKRKRDESAMPPMLMELFSHNDGPPIAKETLFDSYKLGKKCVRLTEGKKVYNPKVYFKNLDFDQDMALRMRESDKVTKELKHCWSVWQDKKGRLRALLNQLQPQMQILDDKAFYLKVSASDEAEMAVDFDIEDDVFVFKPTRFQYRSFEALLRLIEGIGGRKQGVVKVVVPKNCLQKQTTPITPPPEDSREENPELLTSATDEVSLSRSRSARDTILYKFKASQEGNGDASQILPHIRHSKQETQLIQGAADGISWKDLFSNDPLPETSMIAQVLEESSERYSIMDEPVTAQLRATFQCGNPRLGNSYTNLFMKSKTPVVGINEPAIHISSGPGVVFPMQMGEFAAYTLNYHHCGAARLYTVIKPTHHKRLEKVLHNSRGLQDRIRPPTCTQFVSHMQVYVPEETLQRHKIDYTTVPQFEGEMVIMFPWAYHQGYNAGPNIVEEMMYANESWKAFHLQNLYERCNPYCEEGDEEFDLSFLEEKSDDMSGRTDHDTASPNETIPTLVQSSSPKALFSGAKKKSVPAEQLMGLKKGNSATDSRSPHDPADDLESNNANLVPASEDQEEPNSEAVSEHSGVFESEGRA